MAQLDIDGGNRAFAHLPLIGPVIVRNVPRPSEEIVARYQTAFVPDVSDAVGQLYTMNSDIRPLYQPMKRLVGVALTVKIPPGDNIMVHRALGMVQPGDVLVIDSRGYTEACGTGAGSLTLPISQGLAGVVIDGAWRDIGELQALDFPIYGKGISPYSPPKSRPGEINVPVCCGGVIVHPGDVVVCDAEGGVVVPREHAQAVAGELKEYQLRTSLAEWDIDRIARNAVERNAYFDQLFSARGGVYIDWPDTPVSLRVE